MIVPYEKLEQKKTQGIGELKEAKPYEIDEDALNSLDEE
jgi:hypothetical protein